MIFRVKGEKVKVHYEVENWYKGVHQDCDISFDIYEDAVKAAEEFLKCETTDQVIIVKVLKDMVYCRSRSK